MTMHWFLAHEQFNDLIQSLSAAGYPCIGPQVRDNAIVYAPLSHADQLPWGIVDKQTPGGYQLQETGKKTAFGWVNGPQAAKPQLFTPRESVWQVQRDPQGKLEFKPVLPSTAEVKKTLFAIRPCDLRAMLIQDKVFMQGDHREPRYLLRRKNILIVVANCVTSSNNCFCVSAGGYPQAKADFDLALTEIEQGCVIEAASPQGQTILGQLNLTLASKEQINAAQGHITHAAQMQQKRLPPGILRDALFANLDHPRWEEVAARCLSCGNCTQVCPTCFCHSEAEQPNLEGTQSTHVREWDSCFTHDHSYIHGKTIRETTKDRYRQWLTHKLGSWHDQFGESGCVGCGRCISWCPVGIDITEETQAICKG